MRPKHLTWPWRLTCLLGVLALAGPAKAIDPALLPPDTEAVVTINLRQMLTSDMAKAHPDVVAQLKGCIDNQFGDFGVEIRRNCVTDTVSLSK